MRRARLLVPVAALGLASIVGSTVPAGAATVATVTVTGVVTGADGKPLLNVTVLAEHIDGNSVTSVAATATTLRNGSYRLVLRADEPPVSLQFLAARAAGGTSATGYADRCWRGEAVCRGSETTIAPARAAQHPVNVVLRRAAALRGRVVDTLDRGVGGLPVVGNLASGSVPDQTGYLLYSVTDVNGNYDFGRVNPGDLVLGFGDVYGVATGERPVPATPARYGYMTQDATVTVAAGRVVTQNAVLHGGGGVTGTVVDTTGAVVAGAVVSIVGVTDDNLPTATTNAKGRFTIDFLPPRAVDWCVDAPRFKPICSSDPAETQILITQYTNTTIEFTLRRES